MRINDISKTQIAEILRILKSKVKYGRLTPQEISVRKSIQNNDVRSDLSFKCGRFAGVLVKKEDEFPDSLATSNFNGFIISEGPDKEDLRHQMLFFDLFFNEHLKIKTVIAVGKPDESAGFLDYFSPGTKQFDFGNITIRISSESQYRVSMWKMGGSSIDQYRMTIVRKIESFETQKTIILYYISRAPDLEPINFNQADMKILFDLAKNSQENTLLAHCAAGIGRSAIIIFAMALYKNREAIFATDNTEEIADKIFDLLNKFREKRLRAIMNYEQLQQAINLGVKFCQFEFALSGKLGPRNNYRLFPNSEEQLPLVSQRKDSTEEIQCCDKCTIL